MLFYHSGESPEIIGIAQVAREAYQDPTTDNEAWLSVDLKAVKKLKKPISLQQMKTDKRFREMDLIRIGRLSVQTVKEAEWKAVMELSGTK